MKKIIDGLRGRVRVRLTCRFPERLLNMCAGHGVEFWDLRREGDILYMTVYPVGWRALCKMSGDGLFTAEKVSARGFSFFLRGIRYRYGLMAGLLISLAAVWVSGLFIWQVEVRGNETVPTAEILGNLRSMGVKVGAPAFNVDRDDVQNRMLLKMPDLSWLTVNVYGSRCTVIVREKIEKPELVDEKVPCEVYAGKTGIITEVLVSAGTPTVSPGDAVIKGEVLISSVMDSAYAGERQVRAGGVVTAETYYELSARMPQEIYEKRYTGETVTNISLILGEKRGKLYFSGGNPYPLCDKITMYKNVPLPGGTQSPVTVLTETYTEYELVPATVTEGEAETLLKARLLKKLMDEIGVGTVIYEGYDTVVADGVITVTLRARCREVISLTRTAEKLNDNTLLTEETGR